MTAAALFKATPLRAVGLIGAMGILGLLLAAPSPASAAQSGPGCWISVEPPTGPVGTRVSITGSTATCSDGGYGGDFGFSAEHAGVEISPLPAHGAFTFSFRIPAAMPAGDWWAAAQGYAGGGPVAPGPTSFFATMGAPLSARFNVTWAPPGWADFTSIMSSPSRCPSCYQFSPGGYDLVRAGGFVDTFYGAPNAVGSAGDMHLAAPIVDSVFTPDGGGYWMLGADGGVFTYGNAHYYGSYGGGQRTPFVGMASSPDGKGYWLVQSDGATTAFGDAQALSGLEAPPAGIGIEPARPIVGMAATPDGKGYWLVSGAGGIFAFGDAGFYGSMGGRHLNAPVVAMAATPDGRGYWLLGADGGVFSFGDAAFHGAALGVSPFPMIGIAPTPDGAGYWLAASDGGVFTYGDARFAGSGRS